MADHLRQPLADAIDALVEANAYVQRVVSAKSRLGDQELGAFRAREAAEGALRAARKDAPADIVQAILDDADDGEAVREAEAALRAAEHTSDRLERQRASLREEERKARDRLQFASNNRDEAVTALLKAAPEVKSLVAALHLARRRCATIEAALATIPAMSLPPLWYRPTQGDDDVPEDLDLRDRWRKALAALKVDASAELPQHRTVARIERVIVDPANAAAA
jgi:chromosome segregation ATPase